MIAPEEQRTKSDKASKAGDPGEEESSRPMVQEGEHRVAPQVRGSTVKASRWGWGDRLSILDHHLVTVQNLVQHGSRATCDLQTAPPLSGAVNKYLLLS